MKVTKSIEEATFQHLFLGPVLDQLFKDCGSRALLSERLHSQTQQSLGGKNLVLSSFGFLLETGCRRKVGTHSCIEAASCMAQDAFNVETILILPGHIAYSRSFRDCEIQF